MTFGPEPTRWTAEQVAAARSLPPQVAPSIGADDFAAVDAALGIWDAWPITTRDGRPIEQDLWMALAAPWFDDPEQRHGHARIHLLQRTARGWRALGPAMPDGFSPGSREWSGSACVEPDGTTLTLYFTAAGYRDEASPSFNQRLFEAKATLKPGTAGWQLVNWRGLHESVIRDGRFYMDPMAGNGTIGTIKAFRDPGYFRDPETGLHWLFFTGSLASSQSSFNGAIGAAVATGGEPSAWQALPPILTADGVNNELERPHVIRFGGLYYLFWSTQAHVFNPATAGGPTGLYGMVSSDLRGGWAPLNGSGLVIANPPQAPRQAYSWLVLPDLTVASFVDDWGQPAAEHARKRFGGSFAPFLQLELDGAETRLIARA